MTSNQHSRRFDRVEILNRLKAVEAGEMTLYERELVEQLGATQRQLESTERLFQAKCNELVEQAFQHAERKEQLEATQDILRGFLHDADTGDLPGEGLRSMARAALNPANMPPDEGTPSHPGSEAATTGVHHGRSSRRGASSPAKKPS